MTIITLNLNQSVTGTFSATPRATFLDANNKLVIQQAYTATITGGVATLDIPSSQASGVSYQFQAYGSTNVDDFYLADGTLYASTDAATGKNLAPRWQWTTGGIPNNQWYTGSQLGTNAPTTDNKILTKVTRSSRNNYFDPFDAVVGTVNTTLDTLLDLGVTDRQLEYSSYRVADVLTTNPTFRDRLPKGISFQGAYNASTSYSKDQAVQYNGQLWGYVAASTFSGITPGTNEAVWKLLVDKGSPGGVGANSIGWNRTNWLNASFSGDAVSRQDAVGLYDAIPQPDLSGYAALAVANTFTGTNVHNGQNTFNSRVFVPTRPLTDPDTNAVNLKVLKDAIAAITGLITPVYWGRLAANVAPIANTWATIDWDDIVIGSDAAGVITLNAGRYLAICQSSMRLYVPGGGSGTTGRILGRVAMFQNSIENGDLCTYMANEAAAAMEVRPIGIKPFDVAANGTTFAARFIWSSANMFSGNVAEGSIRGSIAQNFLMLLRLS